MLFFIPTRMPRYLIPLLILLLAGSLCPAATQEPELRLDPFSEAAPRTEEPQQPQEPQASQEPRPAQPERQATPWRWGITAGYQHTSVNWLIAAADFSINMHDQVRSHPGFTVGFNASLPFGAVWSFDTGANLSMWGFGYSGAGVTLNATQYALSVPLLITFFESNARIPVFLQAGIQAGLTLFGTQRLDAAWADSLDRRSPFSAASCGVVLGIGYAGFTFQFIQNFTNAWSSPFRSLWEQQTGQTLVNQLQRAYCLTYTYWF